MRQAYAYVTDKNGFELALYSAASLALSQSLSCGIHIFCHQFSAVPPAGFSAAMTGLRASLTYHQIGDPALENHPTCLHVTTPSLLKLSAVARLIGQYDQVAYLDNDLLIFRELPFGGIAFGNLPVAAVMDMDPADTGVLRNSGWAKPGSPPKSFGDYFNSGLMVFRSKNWRGDEFLDRYAAALDQHDILCAYKLDCTSIDQCALNATFENAWVKLPVTYNMQPAAKFTKAWKTAAVRHYGGPRKFIPISAFRNDDRDVRLLNKIRRIFGLPKVRLGLAYEALYQAKVVRKNVTDTVTPRFMRAVENHYTAAHHPHELKAGT